MSHLELCFWTWCIFCLCNAPSMSMENHLWSPGSDSPTFIGHLNAMRWRFIYYRPCFKDHQVDVAGFICILLVGTVPYNGGQSHEVAVPTIALPVHTEPAGYLAKDTEAEEVRMLLIDCLFVCVMESLKSLQFPTQLKGIHSLCVLWQIL